MEITIQKSKKGEETALADGHFLHSNYAPIKEAQRFVDNLTLSYTPKQIIIIEPALSYCADFLRVKFPGIKLGVIRYEKSFAAYNSKFDFVLNYFDYDDFETYLENCFNEEDILLTYFVSWPASAQIYSENEKVIWKAIKNAFERSKTLLITRQYFEKKWLVNSFNFFRNINQIVSFNKQIDKDVLILASGPSLKPFINYIQENQNKFFIICLSSAISVCLHNNIKPDLCMTTDGGFWAGEHLKKLQKHDIPVAMPSEAFCSKRLLNKLAVLPLLYGEGISKDLTIASRLKYKSAVRNGTVSGTALLFAFQYAAKNVYFCGLDMANQTGFQHTQPNELELNNSLYDNRIKNKETRIAKSGLTNGSLDIYKNWFSSNKLDLPGRKVYRLIESKDRKNNLNWIEDIDLSKFQNLTKSEASSKSDIFTKSEYSCNCNELLKIITDNNNIEKIKQQLFPLDYVSLIHNNNDIAIKEKIETEWNNLVKKLSGIINEHI